MHSKPERKRGEQFAVARRECEQLVIIIELEIALTGGGGSHFFKKKALLKRKKALLLEGVTFQNAGGKKALIVTCLSLRSAAPRQTTYVD